MMTKKALSILLALLLLTLPGLSLAESAEAPAGPATLTNTDGFVYTVNPDGTAVIAGYTGGKDDLVIPASIDGHTVTAIGSYAFSGSPLTGVTVPDSVKTIADSAFAHSRSLTRVRLPEGLETLETCAFLYCRELTEVNLPDSLQSISSSVFSGCAKLETVALSADHPRFELVDGVLFTRGGSLLIWYPACRKGERYTVPEGTQRIDYYAFNNAENLTAVQIPESVTEIRNNAFNLCGKLREVNIPAQVTRLDGVFKGCTSLTHVQVSPDNPVFYSVDGVLFHREEQALVLYPAGRGEDRYVVPEGTLAIGFESFADAASLEEIVLPASLTRIGNDAFFKCTSLKTVEMPETLEVIEGLAFQHCHSLSSIRLPRGLTKVGGNPFVYCRSLREVTVDDDHPLLAIMNRALVSKTDMTLLWYPLADSETRCEVAEGVTAIDGLAFCGCAQLKEVILPEGLRSIGYYAFEGCRSLERVVLPASLEEIVKTAFDIQVGRQDEIHTVYVVTKGSYAENFCLAYGLAVEYAE